MGNSPPETEEQVREACLRLLAARPRSRRELATRLARRGAPAEVVEPVLDRLSRVELIDDVAFARAWVQNRHAHSGRGRRALTAELHAKGVNDEVVRAAVAEVDDDAERERAVELVRRRLRRTPIPADARERAALTRKLSGYLARRGYPHGVAAAAIASELDTSESDAGEVDPR